MGDKKHTDFLPPSPRFYHLRLSWASGVLSPQGSGDSEVWEFLIRLHLPGVRGALVVS
jgi:hypothetical protein